MDLIFSGLGAILQVIGLILFKYQGWILVVALLGYFIWQNKRKQQWVGDTEHILLLIEVPKENEKKELSAEQMFASLHGILRPRKELRKEGSLQEHVSFEIASIGNQIQFYVWCPKHLKDFVEGQIYAQYPTVHIREGAEDYSRSEVGERTLVGAELHLMRNDMLPIKTFASFEVDPLAGITAVLAKLEESNEEMWIQILARPLDDSWQDKGLRYIEQLKSGKRAFTSDAMLNALLEFPLWVITQFLPALVAPPESDKKDNKKPELSTGKQTAIKAVEEKITKLGYQVKVRIAYLGPENLTRHRMQAIVGGFKQFNTTNLNGFAVSKIHHNQSFLQEYRARLFMDNGSILNIEELASLYHLPHKSVETPNIVWTISKTAEPPSTLPTEKTTEPDEVSLFGMTNFRGGQIKFGIKRRDRARHLYLVGQTGTGKSMLLQLLTLSDIYHNHGVAIIDPHGDYATDMMKYIPEHRLKDVVYFNPADTDYPMAFNPMEVTDPNAKNHITSELVGVLKRMFEYSWGPRLEYILRYTILALLDYPNATMLDITRMLTEKDFRKEVIRLVEDPVVKNFWVTEFAAWNDKFASEAVAPVLNKVGAFTANPLIRNVVGQPKSAFSIRKIMDEGKILIVNLSSGRVGDDNASILGALMVTKIQLAAMSRADIPMDQRRPFYLYVDEFQNFATDSFAVILSEARKYALNLTVANQYIAQMPENVRDAVFGNVGSMITFRIGAADATYLARYFEPVFEPGDLVKINNQNVYVTMSIDGEKTLPFSAQTLRMPEPEEDLSEKIIQLSREHYSSDRSQVEVEIKERSGSRPGADRPVAEPTRDTEQKPNTFLGGLKNPQAAHRPQHDRNRQPRRHDKPQHKRQQDRPEPAVKATEISPGQSTKLR